jgi:shikimate kinase
MNATLEAPQTEIQQTPSLSNLPRSRPIRAPRPAERIVLTGFMGSGKSTIGQLLAAELGWNFVDLDAEIERRTGQTVPEIFATQGEEAFRKQETAALVNALGHARTVIALGGGAPETLGNRLLLEQTPATAVVYLAAPFSTLAERCAQQADAIRPNFADHTAAEARFAVRQPLYQRLAHVSIETGGLSPEDSVAAVLAAVAANTSRA